MAKHSPGTPQVALAKAFRAFHLGLAPHRSDPHSKTGDFVRRNADELARDPHARIVIYDTAAGTASHSAVLAAGKAHGAPDSRDTRVKERWELPVSVFVSQAPKFAPDTLPAAFAR
jgi:hypothetical protein